MLEQMKSWIEVGLFIAILVMFFGLIARSNVLFSLGPNTEVGGTNDTACHLDMPMRNCSLWLDGKSVVENGRIAMDEMRVPGR